MRTKRIGAGVVLVGAFVLSTLVTSGRQAQPPATPPAPGGSQQVIDDLVVGNRILANEGVVDGLGHLSVRSDQRPDRFLISRDLAPGLVTAADLVEYDLEGGPVAANSPRGYSERFIHAAIYRARPDVGAIVHAHTPSVVAFSVSSVPLRPVYHVAPFLLPGVPIFEIRSVEGHQGMLVNDPRSGTALAASLADKAVTLMRGHGFVVVGAVIPEVVHRAIVMDVNARMQAQAMALGGKVQYLAGSDVADGGQKVQPTVMTEYTRGWAVWKDKVTRR